MKKFAGLETKEIESCPACHSKDNSIFSTRGDGMSLYKCSKCQTLYVSEYPIEIDRLYEGSYFGMPHESGRDGIGYQSGYTPIHEQIWQVGLTLIAADILKIPCENILDIGCATGQFLSLCRAFDLSELNGIELSATAAATAMEKGLTVSNCDIAQYQSANKHQIVTAWDVIEHLPDPFILTSKVNCLLKKNGAFCFSTPNGDIPTNSSVAENWEGFNHSFEHIFYVTQSGANSILKSESDNMFLYPVSIYGGDFLLGILSKTSVTASQQHLLNCLFANPAVLVLAAQKRELSPLGISGLICLYMMFGKIVEASELLDILSPLSSKLPVGIWEIVQGSVFARLGRVDEAQQQYDIGLNIFRTREIALSSYSALLQIYKNEKECYVDLLSQQVTNFSEELRICKAEFKSYKDDKETYIAALKIQVNPRKSIFSKIKYKFKFAAKNIVVQSLPMSIRTFWQNLSDESICLKPISQTIVYAADNLLFADYPKRVNLKVENKLKYPIPITLISTVFNEETAIILWLKSIAAQTRTPDEVIIVDAGSTDNTRSIIENFAVTSHLMIKLIVSPGATIAQGRNLAVRVAQYAIIACTDVGCEADPYWLEKLIAPFEIDPDTDVVAGWTKAIATTTFQKSLAFLSVLSNYSQVDPNNYIPSSRTIAFTKNAWEQVGGYPEWATFAGEDSFFGLMLKNQCSHWAFTPEAIVNWHMRTTWKAVYKQAYLYGFGDGELAIYSQNYKRDLKFLLILSGLIVLGLPMSIVVASIYPWAGIIISGASLGLLISAVKKITNKFIQTIDGLDVSMRGLTVAMLGKILIARVHGFINGTMARSDTFQRRFISTIGTVIIFSGVPIDDSGGGQRATQLALEFLDQGYRVVFLNQYPSYETIDLHLSIRHPNLETKPIDLFDPNTFIKTHDLKKKLIAIAEFPHPSFIESMIFLQSEGAKIVYDLIDDWRSSLGGDWYSQTVEEEFIRSCDLLVASAQTLQERLAIESGKDVLLVPNAVNQRIFKKDVYSIPEDMVRGELTLIYIGALWGEWFDWELLVLVAKSYPRAQVIVIGDYNDQCPEKLSNLHFLGLKPQSELPKYLTHADFALIPFKVSELTQAVSPLKVFEYLSMGVPVISTYLNEVSTMPCVYVANSHQDFIDKIIVAASMPVDFQEIDNFIQSNTWKQRIDAILSGIED